MVLAGMTPKFITKGLDTINDIKNISELKPFCYDKIDEGALKVIGGKINKILVD